MKNSAGSIKISTILRSVIVSILTMLVLAIILAIIAFASSWQHSDLILNICNYLSILVGACYCGFKLKYKLWLNGAIVGIIYLLALTLIRADLSLVLQWAWIKQLLIVGGIGILGGLTGGFIQN